MDLTKNENSYRKLIEGKRVIFVGPSPIMKGRKLGKWIDDFDLVIRMNGASLILDNKKLISDYGNRLDILYTNVQFLREMHPIPIEKLVENGLKTMCFKTNDKGKMLYYDEHCLVRSYNATFSRLSKTIDTLLSGTALLSDILIHNPAELYLTGVDFYINKPKVFVPKDWREYCPGYLPKKIRDKANIKNLNKIDGHKKYPNAKHIYDLWKLGKIKISKFIEPILEEIINNKEKYISNEV